MLFRTAEKVATPEGSAYVVAEDLVAIMQTPTGSRLHLLCGEVIESTEDPSEIARRLWRFATAATDGVGAGSNFNPRHVQAIKPLPGGKCLLLLPVGVSMELAVPAEMAMRMLREVNEARSKMSETP